MIIMSDRKIGMFNLPGIFFEDEIPNEDTYVRMEQWCKDNKCGYKMTERIWCFKSEKQRTQFTIRWHGNINT